MNANPNPYASPLSDSAPDADQDDVTIDRALVRQFESELTALAGFWCIVGVCAAGIGYAISDSAASTWFDIMMHLSAGLLLTIGLACVVLGVLTGLRRMSALRAALGLTYFAILLPPVLFSIIGVAMLLLVVAQAHRVLKTAAKLERANLPLHLRADQVDLYRRGELTTPGTQSVQSNQ